MARSGLAGGRQPTVVRPFKGAHSRLSISLAVDCYGCGEGDGDGAGSDAGAVSVAVGVVVVVAVWPNTQSNQPDSPNLQLCL